MNATTFADLNLIEPIQRALEAEKYTIPTAIQAQSIPHLLEGKDLLGCAQTGTGKTAAFALPILQRLDANRKAAVARTPRVLVLSPTRELAAQIGESFETYGKNLRLRHTVIYGGVGQTPQVRALSRGVHIVIATPGRLLDLIAQGHIRLDGLEVFVLDEADRMLDMGFMPDLKRIVAMLPKKRQSLFFSATMPGNIAQLADSLLVDPVRVTITPPANTVELIEQRVMFVDKDNKRALLAQLLENSSYDRVLVFTRTKHGADKVAKQISQSGMVADAIHGNKSQAARQRTLARFKAGSLRVLVATDVAARGIDVEGVSHVINYDMPHEAENYVHRIGRTGRAGATGVAVSFCESGDRAFLRAVERLVRRPIEVDIDHPFHLAKSISAGPKSSEGPRPAHRRSGYGGAGRSGSNSGSSNRSSSGSASRPGSANRTGSARKVDRNPRHRTRRAGAGAAISAASTRQSQGSSKN